MERRDFFKLVGIASGGALTGACGKKAAELLPVLVPEQAIVPGVEEWHPSVCRECPSGCGVIVRVMEAQRRTEQNGEAVLEPVAAIKKVEGNPLDPVSGGRLCARGQASVQRLYHPDRLRGPKKRSNERGESSHVDVSWDEALDAVAARLKKADAKRIVYLSRPESGTRAASVERFLDALGAEPASTIGIHDFTVERRAARAVFGWLNLPVYDIQDATYVLGIGADFLGGWISPVFYARRFGHFRQGRPQIRGELVHAESRFSQTAWAADRWLPVLPGGEQALALALGRLLIEEHGIGGGVADDIREAFLKADLDDAARTAGLELNRIARTAAELASTDAPLVVGGASIVRTNSLAAVATANALNLLLGAVDRKGGVQPPASAAVRPEYRDLGARLEEADIVFLDGVNPGYSFPAWAERLRPTATVVNFTSFTDDSAAACDWILPDHDALESSAVVVPPTAPVPALTGAGAFVKPQYETRAVEETLRDLARRLDKSVEVETPKQRYESLYQSVETKEDWTDAGEFAKFAERQGGWWPEGSREIPPSGPSEAAPLESEEPDFEGAPGQYPLYFQPYLSLQYGDGSSANLPWLQELPDPASSALWGLPVEIDPQTADKMGVGNGDRVRLVTPAGSLEAAAYVHPAAIPGVVSLAVGQGHREYGRYASGRGANPLAVVAPLKETHTGVPAFGATRCRLEKAEGSGGLLQFSTVDRERDLVRR